MDSLAAGGASAAHLAGAVYRCVVSHHRLEGARYSFTHRLNLFITDVDDVSGARRGNPLRRVCADDHLGIPGRSLRENVDQFLRHGGVNLDGGTVLMLSQCRGLGYVFDPITLFWCHDSAGRLACVIAEVRNTFGDRHCYLLRPDPSGNASAAKQLYVSPFFPVDGRYAFRLKLSESRIWFSVTLYRPGPDEVEVPALVATLRGGRVYPGTARRVAAMLANPVTVRWTMARIRYQSWQLRRRGLRLRRRRFHAPQPGVQVTAPTSASEASGGGSL